MDGGKRARLPSGTQGVVSVTACNPTSNAAYRRYVRRFWPATVLYALGIVLATGLIPDDAGATPLTVGIALLPGLGMVLMIWAIGRLLIELDDEYLKMLEIRKALAATGVVLVVSSVWGILEIYTDVPRLPLFLMFPIWCGGLMVGQLWNWKSGA